MNRLQPITICLKVKFSINLSINDSIAPFQKYQQLQIANQRCSLACLVLQTLSFELRFTSDSIGNTNELILIICIPNISLLLTVNFLIGIFSNCHAHMSRFFNKLLHVIFIKILLHPKLFFY